MPIIMVAPKRGMKSIQMSVMSMAQNIKTWLIFIGKFPKWVLQKCFREFIRHAILGIGTGSTAFHFSHLQKCCTRLICNSDLPYFTDQESSNMDQHEVANKDIKKK